MEVYLVTNIINQKKYVGQTTYTASHRWKGHCNSKTFGYLRRAIAFYGRDKFKVEVLEVVATREELGEREKYYIQKFNTLAPNGYNIAKGGFHTPMSEETKLKIGLFHKGRKHSVESKIKMSESHKNISDQTRAKMRESQKGKKHSDETKLKIAQGNKGKTVSEHVRLKIRESRKLSQRAMEAHEKSKKNIICVETGEVFQGVESVLKKFNIGRSTLYRILSGESNSYKGHSFKRVKNI